MPEKTPTIQPTPEPLSEPAPEEKKQAQSSGPVFTENIPEKTPAPKKKGGWFKKIPSDVLLSPRGMVLIFFALIMEIIDVIPIPFIDQLWELPLEIIFITLLIIIAKVPLKSCLIPFLIERIPVISDILPTWVMRMLM